MSSYTCAKLKRLGTKSESIFIFLFGERGKGDGKVLQGFLKIKITLEIWTGKRSSLTLTKTGKLKLVVWFLQWII